MNAKACKRMRRMAVATTDVVSEYSVAREWNGWSNTGEPIRLIRDCQRDVYKQLKRHYRAANQTIRARLNANAYP